MPIFDVRCQDKECDTVTEVVCKHDDLGEQVCSKCKGSTTSLIGAADFRLKGSGWAGLEISNTKNWGGGNKRWEKD